MAPKLFRTPFLYRKPKVAEPRSGLPPHFQEEVAEVTEALMTDGGKVEAAKQVVRNARNEWVWLFDRNVDPKMRVNMSAGELKVLLDAAEILAHNADLLSPPHEEPDG